MNIYLHISPRLQTEFMSTWWSRQFTFSTWNIFSIAAPDIGLHMPILITINKHILSIRIFSIRPASTLINGKLRIDF
ncbi:hypothetical protein QQ73_16960 [Candidatus Endoriftia persephone str. Guaymas]|nr:hypothetical protein [Candidatus Endoriftia persephone str. Guaymas]